MASGLPKTTPTPRLLLRERLKPVSLLPSKFQREKFLNVEKASTGGNILPRIGPSLDMREPGQKLSSVAPKQSLFGVSPPEMVFQNVPAHEVSEMVVSIINKDEYPRLVKVSMKSSPYFQLACPNDAYRMVPAGMSTRVRVRFTPNENKDYSHELVCMSGREWIVVPIRAIAARAILDFPDQLDFSVCPVKCSTQKTLLVRNVGNRAARYQLRTQSPFSVVPATGTLGVGDTMQVTVGFHPLTTGDHSGALVVCCTGEKSIHTNLQGKAEDVNIELNTNFVKVEKTFVNMSNHATMFIKNSSNITAHFQWKAFPTEEHENKEKRRQCSLLQPSAKVWPEAYIKDKKMEKKKGFCENRAPLLSNKYKQDKAKVQADPMLFSNDIFFIEPMEGEIGPRCLAEIKVTFKPLEAREYQCVAYCNISGRESRLPLCLRGEGQGPLLELCSDTLNLGSISVNTPHNCEVKLNNKGVLDAPFTYIPSTTKMGSCFKFAPEEGIIAPGGIQTIQISFNATVLGCFEERFQFSVAGSPTPVILTIKGHVTRPTLHFDVDELDFGDVSFDSAKGSRNFPILGIGTTIVTDKPFTPELNLGYQFSLLPCIRRFKLTNGGRHFHRLFWKVECNSPAEGEGQSTSALSGPKAGDDSQSPKRTRPVFGLEPPSMDLQPGESVDMVLQGFSRVPQVVRDYVRCEAVIGTGSVTKKIIETIITCEFIDPSVEVSARQFSFRVEKKHSNVLTLQYQPLTIKNTCSLPLDLTLSLERPFQVCNANQQPLADGQPVTVDVKQTCHLYIAFDPAYKLDFNSWTEKKVLKIEMVRGHPAVEQITLWGEVHFPNLQIQPSTLEFGCIVAGTEEVHSLEMTNCSSLPVKCHWAFQTDSRVSRSRHELHTHKFKPEPPKMKSFYVGHLAARRRRFKIRNVEEPATTPEELRALAQSSGTEVSDTENILGIVQAENIEVSAEVYDVSLSIDMPEAPDGSLEFGTINVLDKVKKVLRLKNKGLYNTEYSFTLKDAGPSIQDLASHFTVEPQSGVLTASQPGVNIEMLFHPTREILLENKPILYCQVTDASSGQTVNNIPVRVSAKAVYSKYSIEPASPIDFGAMLKGTKKTQTVVLENKGVLSFKFRILQAAKDISALESQSSKQGESASSATKHSMGRKSSSSIQGPLNLGMFTVSPCSGSIGPWGQQKITVECLAGQEGTCEEQLYIDITSRDPKDNPLGVPFTLTAESCLPALVEDVTSIFEEYPICSTADCGRMLQSVKSIGLFVRDENKFIFSKVLVQQKAEAHFNIYSANGLPCDVVLSIQPLPGKEKSLVNEVFKLHPVKMSIPGSSYAVATVTFIPPDEQTYDCTFKACLVIPKSSVKIKPQILTFTISGKGHEPQVTVVCPSARSNRGNSVLRFKRLQLGDSEMLPLVVCNKGIIPVKFTLHLEDEHGVFFLKGRRSTLERFHTEGVEEDSAENESKPIKPFLLLHHGQSTEFDVFFKPTLAQRLEGKIHVLVGDKYSNKTLIELVGEGHKDEFTLDRLEEDRNAKSSLEKDVIDAVRVNHMQFGDFPVGEPCHRTFTVPNHTCVKVMRFEWEANAPLQFSSKVGHLHPGCAKDITEMTVTLKSDVPATLRRDPVKCEVIKINFEQPQEKVQDGDGQMCSGTWKDTTTKKDSAAHCPLKQKTLPSKFQREKFLSEKSQASTGGSIQPRIPDMSDTGQKLTPSAFRKEMSLTTQQRLARDKKLTLPQIAQPQAKHKTSHHKSSATDPEQSSFQPCPPEVVFQNYSPGQVYEIPVLLRNRDKVPHRLKVTLESLPYLKLVGPNNVYSKVPPGLHTTVRILFSPAENKDYFHKLVCITEREEFIVPIRAIGARAILDFPDQLDFSECPVKYSTQKTLLVRNVGNRKAHYQLSTQSPFSVVPAMGALDIGNAVQVTVGYEPLKTGDCSTSLVVHYDTGEDTHTSLHGRAVDVAIELDRNSVTFGETYITLSKSTTMRIHNLSDITARFQWKAVDTQGEEELKLRRYQRLCQLEKDKFRDLEACGVDTTRRELFPNLTRRLQSEKAKVQEDPMLFKNDIFSIEPKEGEIMPNCWAEISVFFKPREARVYEQAVYCDISGREKRLPLHLIGEGLGPRLLFNYKELDIGEVFVTANLRYKTILLNRGLIAASFSLVPPTTAMGSCFTFLTQEGIVAPNGLQAIWISFRPTILGAFEERFQFSVAGSPTPAILTIKGFVMAPTFHFDVPALHFGDVSYGFPRTLKCRLFNTSLVSLDVNLHIPGDGSGQPSVESADQMLRLSSQSWRKEAQGVMKPREFSISPCRVGVLAQGSADIQVTLCSNTVRDYKLELVVDVDGACKNVLALTLTARCIVPPLRVLNPVVMFEHCCLQTPYKEKLTLVNDSDFPGCYCFLPQEDKEKAAAWYSSSVPSGIIKAHSSVEIPITLEAQLVGECNVPAELAVFGREGSPLEILLEFIGSGPVVYVHPQKINFGKTPVLQDRSKTLHLSNQCGIPATFCAEMAGKRSCWRIVPSKGVIPPDCELDVTVIANVNDTRKLQDKVKVFIENSPTIFIPVQAVGTGTTIVSNKPLGPKLDLGSHFSFSPCRYEFQLTNKGRRFHRLYWSTAGSHILRQSSCRPALGGTKSKGASQRPRPGHPVFKLQPLQMDLRPGQTVDMVLEGCSRTVQEVEERLLCHVKVGKDIIQKEMIQVDVTCKFICPVVQISSRAITFRVEKKPTDVLTLQYQPLSLKNTCSLPFSFVLGLEQPFQICSVDKQPLPADSKPMTLDVGEELHLCIQFNPAYEKGLNSWVAERVLRMRIMEHPHKEKITVRGEVHFPNLHLEAQAVNFGCIINNTEEELCMEMTNCSPLPVEYYWSFLTHRKVNTIRFRPSPPKFKCQSSKKGVFLRRHRKIESAEKPTETPETTQDSVEEDPAQQPADAEDSLEAEELSSTALEPWSPGKMREFSQSSEVQHHKVRITDVFAVRPLSGVVQPGESVPVTFTFFGHANIVAHVTAQCHVKGGPTYKVVVAGKASCPSYQLDVEEIDWGLQVFNKVLKAEVTLRNTGVLEFTYVVPNSSTGTAANPLPGVPVVVPTEGSIAPGKKQVLEVYYLPGKPGVFCRTFQVQVAYLDPAEIFLKGEGTLPRTTKHLPRMLKENEEILQEEEENPQEEEMESTAADLANSAEDNETESSIYSSEDEP